MIRPGVIALAQALKDALELPEGLTGQAMLNFSDGTLQSVETRTFERVRHEQRDIDKRAVGAPN